MLARLKGNLCARVDPAIVLDALLNQVYNFLNVGAVCLAFRYFDE
jgi:hypothetical protein